MNPAILACSLVVAVSPRWAYEDAYDNVAEGDWYIGETNDEAVLAWGESYVMMSLAAMYRATGDRMYLDRLARHIDGVLEQRDDARGVTDYRGVAAACWQTTAYQDEPYCYVVHSGMLIYPMAEFYLLVQDSGLAGVAAGANETYADKAERFLAAAEESVAAHEDQWDPAGFYRFRADANFLNYAGEDLPFNQSHAMGRALLRLHEATGDASYLAKATAMAQWFRGQMSEGQSGELLWNYWGGAYQANGEDISHAAINVDFAALAAEYGVVFSEADVDSLATTFMAHVYLAHTSYSDFIGGGPANNPSYRPQIGRWLRLTRARTSVYAGVRELFEREYPAAGVGSGSILLGWANLAAYEPVHCPHFFYSVDWQDFGDYQQATAYGANVLTTPPALDEGCLIPLQANVPRPTEVGQWDDNVFHRVAEWTPTNDFEPHYIPYEPKWPFVYWQDGVLFQFTDTFVENAGIEVSYAGPSEPPTITTEAPGPLTLGVDPWVLDADATGETPIWWSVSADGLDVAIDYATGEVSWSGVSPGSYPFVITATNAFGSDELAFTLIVEEPDETTTGEATSDGTSDGTTGETDDPSDSTTGETDDPSEGPQTSSGTGDTTDAGTTGTVGGSASESGDTGAMTDGEGCSCNQRSDAPLSVLWLLGLVAFGRRR